MFRFAFRRAICRFPFAVCHAVQIRGIQVVNFAHGVDAFDVCLQKIVLILDTVLDHVMKLFHLYAREDFIEILPTFFLHYF